MMADRLEKSQADFEEQLRQMYWCERELADKLPDMAKHATSYELSSAILAHLAVTENQVIRLLHVFDALGERATGQKLQHICTMLEHADTFALLDPGYFRDVELINTCQRIMQHEISAYGKLYELALQLHEEQAAEYLLMAIKEEHNAYARLHEIKLSAIYFDAAS